MELFGQMQQSHRLLDREKAISRQGQEVVVLSLGIPSLFGDDQEDDGKDSPSSVLLIYRGESQRFLLVNWKL